MNPVSISTIMYIIVYSDASGSHDFAILHSQFYIVDIAQVYDPAYTCVNRTHTRWMKEKKKTASNID